MSLKSTVHNMPSAPLPPLVIDQYLLIWHMINYCQHPGEMTILAGLTNCSIFTFLGDENFSSRGKDLVFYSPPYGHFYLISQSHQTQLEHLSMVRFLVMNGLLENCPSLNNLYLSPKRNCLVWLWQLCYGATDEPQSGSWLFDHGYSDPPIVFKFSIRGIK